MSGSIPLNNATSIPSSNPTILGDVSTQAPTNYVNQPPIQTSLTQLAQISGNTPLPQLTNNLISTLASNGIVVNPLSNVLNQYANYTYHIKWSVTNDIIASNLTNATDYLNDNLVAKEIIAESGVTAGFSIYDLEINSIPAPGSKVQSMIHTNFTMTVKEPFGFSLLDRLYSYGQQFGISNHLTSPYFIEIWFTGYNEDGTIAGTQQQSWRLFRTIITSIVPDVTEAGTTYRIEGIVDGSYGNADHIAVLPQNLTISDVKTIGEFFQRLSVQMNDLQKNINYDGVTRVFYKFKGLNTITNGTTLMKDWKFTRQATSNARSTSPDISVNRDTQTISINRGMDISTILYFVMSMTDEGRQFVAGQVDGTTANGSTANIQANGMGHIICIHTKSVIIGFDYLLGDYIREITYTFNSYETNRAMIDRLNINTTQQPANQISRASVQLNSGRYNKFYNFIFTGENTDILKFDIRLENYWQASLPSQLGENTYSNFTQGRLVGNGTIDQAVLNQYKQARADNIQATAQLQQVNEKLRDGSGNASLLQSQQQLLQQKISSTQAIIDAAGNNAAQFQVFFNNQSAGQQAVSGALSSINSGSSSISSSTSIISSISSSTRQSNFLETQAVNAPTTTSPLPVSFKQDPTPMTQVTQVGGAESKSAAGTGQTPSSIPRSGGLVSAVLNDVMTTTFMVNIELEIRGDPYWLGVGNVAEDQILDSITDINSALGGINSSGILGNNNSISVSPNTLSQLTNPSDPSAWFYNGENGFILNFRTGTAPDESTGIVSFDNTSIVFYGLYSVTNVKNRFSGGAFTQILTGYKDVLLNDQSVFGNVSGLATEATANIASGAAGL